VSGEDAWAKGAGQWERFQPPYRPHRDDTAVVERVAAALAAEGGALRAVILGVTPQTVGCAWPAETRLTAIDSSQAVIDALWPPPGTPAGAEAICAEWTALPFEDGSVDLVAADGSVACFDYPDGFARLLREVRRVLKPTGRFVARTFLRPEQPERIDDILADLHAGRIGGPYPLKMRFSMTFHEPGLGISRGKWRDAWFALFPDQEASARRFGWSLERFTLPSRAATDEYIYYPTLNQLRAVTARSFEEVGFSTGNYELAARCPTLVLAPIA
jgi:SAM-dependent methyltransferase